MQIDVLLSIKPEFAEAIFSGKKTFEFRRKIFRKKDVKKIYVYASRPTSLVIGHFEIKQIISDTPSTLWKLTKESSGVTKSYFDSYFSGRQIAYAIQVTSVQKYSEPSTLMELFEINRPPQSFMYVKSKE